VFILGTVGWGIVGGRGGETGGWGEGGGGLGGNISQ